LVIRLTRHARVVIDARMLQHDWIAQTLANPEWTSRAGGVPLPAA
jgi:hypothetical protein